MNAAAQNARDLASDARLLLENGRIARALSLAILSIEESGKNAILRGIATAVDDKELKAHWKRFRSHKAKNAHWILIDLGLKGARTLEDLKPIYDDSSDHPDKLDQLKQAMFYTDLSSSNQWSIPEKVADADFTASLVRAAELISDKKEHTDTEIELWKKHMGPAKRMPLPDQKTALRAWYKEMEEHGLFSEGKISLDEFLGN